MTTEPRPHPAKYSSSVLDAMATMIRAEVDRLDLDTEQLTVLDPMAGVGGVHQLPGRTFGIELEEEWADQHPQNEVGDCLDLPFRDNRFHVIAVSPCYGSRMADHHEAKDDSKRITYRHTLGRMPTPGSSAVLQYGPEYREFHQKAWKEATRVLMPGGLFVLNISNFIRSDKVVNVSEWHIATLFNIGYTLESAVRVQTPRMRFGQNHRARVDGELVIGFRSVLVPA